MKRLLLSMSLLILYGCSFPSTGSENVIEPTSEECPEKPEIALVSKNVKPILLSEKTIVESGITSKSKSSGYTFDAQAGQKLNYQANKEICVWIYTPDNQLINSGVLPKTGKYTIQVSAPKEPTTFDLTMSLGTAQVSSPLSVNRESQTKRESVAKSPSASLVPESPTTEVEYFDWLSERQLTEADLRGKTGFELDIMRNAIYACHGRRFKSQDLQNYFARQSWYRPKYSPEEFPVSLLSPLEKENAKFIWDYQERHNLRWVKVQ